MINLYLSLTLHINAKYLIKQIINYIIYNNLANYKYYSFLYVHMSNCNYTLITNNVSIYSILYKDLQLY